ncbi:MAG: response regulator [Gammaproteobacteria bacterium]|nr:response regulator [Gammaproteobacteria bacterium]
MSASRWFARLGAVLAGNLRRRLVFGAAITNVLIIAVVVGDVTWHQREKLVEHETEHALALARSVATSSAGWLAAFDVSGLHEILVGLERYPDLRYAMILDMRGLVVAHSDAGLVNRYVLDLPAQPASTAAFIAARTADLIDAYCPIVLSGRQIGWVRVGIWQRGVSRQLAGLARHGVYYAVVAALLGIAVAALLGNWMTRRLRAIQRVAGAVAAGDRSQRAALTGEDEAAALALAFDAMLDTLAAREVALRDSESRYRDLMQGIHVAIVVHDADGVILDSNAEAAGLLGISTAAPRQRDSSDPGWKFVDPDGRMLAPDETPVNQVRRTGKPLRNFTAGIVRGTAGEPVWVLVNADPVADAAGVLGQVRVSFIDVSDKKRMEDRLRDSNLRLEEHVAARTAELAGARDAAEAANRAKSIFLANMSHELRTPLNAVLGFAQIMARDPALAATHRHELEVIDRSGRHLLALINDVLEISRIEAGRTHSDVDVFDLPATLTGIAEMVRTRAEEKGLALVVDLGAGLPSHVRGDAAHLRQVLLNLLGNAVKFTDAGEIRLAVRRAAGRIAFEVVDTGPGIPADERERVFEAFHQGAVGTAKGEGTGLGLAICRNHVALMGGEIMLEPVVPHGCRFSFTLALPADAGPVPATSGGRVAGLVPGQRTPRVLVVDDDEDSRLLLEALLVRLGVQVRVAPDGRAAVETFTAWKPDLVWMDMRMPVMDGYEATRRIRALPGGAAVRIVALTASAFREDRGAILAAGCDDVLAKPMDETLLLETMSRLLRLVYRYEPAAVPAAAHEPDLGAVPAALRDELARAAELLDMDEVARLVVRLRALDDTLAEQIEILAGAYRYDRIAALCRAAGGALTPARD